MTLSPLAGLMWSKTGRSGVTVHPQVVVEASAEATNANGATAATRATRATLRGLGTENFMMSPWVDGPRLRRRHHSATGVSAWRHGAISADHLCEAAQTWLLQVVGVGGRGDAVLQ